MSQTQRSGDRRLLVDEVRDDLSREGEAKPNRLDLQRYHGSLTLYTNGFRLNVCRDNEHFALLF